MSLTLGLGFASVRVLLGLVGVGYSLLKADFGEGAKVSNEILKSVVGETAGGLAYDFLKGGGQSALKQFVDSLQQGDSEHLNHDLQRAARKAQLTATLLAVRACLAETRRLNHNEKSFWSKASGLVRKDQDEKWLNEVAKLWQQKIDNLPKEVPPQIVEEDQLIGLFDPKLNLEPTDVQKQLVEKLKEDALKEILTEYTSISPLPEAASKLLEEAIKTGWNEFADDTAHLTSLNLYRPEQKRALINTNKQYDWFSLVCGLFNEVISNSSAIPSRASKHCLKLLTRSKTRFSTSSKADLTIWRKGLTR